MSRIGKQIINIPEKTEVIIDDSTVTVKGPIGELKRTFLNVVSIKKEENKITVNPVEKTIFAKAM
ncbi:MAG: 50S ribosomal protein L6 [Candidatus Pacebacteria bacterium]|nr:50S ribosomal protein L6 [Candidatus Paceibacterota bacterium]